MSDLKFPQDFQFGVATAAYQIEGAWNIDGKGESIWDYHTHTFPDKIADKSNGDIASDSYHRLDEDIAALKYLGVHFYRFSICWPRILPSGFSNQINQAGIAYYNKLIDKLIANGITPLVTIYHWDLPQPLQELGGWTNPLLADYFVSFARVCFREFGDRVKSWITFNEPMQITYFAYSWGLLAPFYKNKGIASYLAGHTLLIAHGKTYRLYQEEFKRVQNGKVGITIEIPWAEPLTETDDDIKATERYMQMYFGWFAHPIYSKTGDYPPIMRQRIDQLSKEQGFEQSRLPSFTPAQIKLIQGSYDFLGINHYVTVKISNSSEGTIPSEEHDQGRKFHFDPAWKNTARDMFKVAPHGLRKILNWIKQEYDNPEVIISENGYCGYEDEGLNDVERIDYLTKYLNSVLEAVVRDKCNVKGYAFWTLFDNFEWSDGYTKQFGLFHVDYRSGKLERVPKDSVEVYRKIIHTGMLQLND